MPTIPIEELRETLHTSKARWVPKENAILKLSETDRRRRLGVVVDEGKRRSEGESAAGLAIGAGASAALLVPSVDWRNYNGANHVTSVKDQRNCGSCVSFCVVSVVESMVSIEHGTTLDLSEADLHFCSDHGASCDGWHSSDAIGQVWERGVTLESEFPYASAFPGPHCILGTHRDVNSVRVEHRQGLWSVVDRKWWIANVGPVCASFEVFSDFYSYGGGVYEHRMGGSEGTHCVAVVGYSDVDKCWICKNSWGSGWGDKGFFRIAYGQCRIDPGPIPVPPYSRPLSPCKAFGVRGPFQSSPFAGN